MIPRDLKIALAVKRKAKLTKGHAHKGGIHKQDAKGFKNEHVK